MTPSNYSRMSGDESSPRLSASNMNKNTTDFDCVGVIESGDGNYMKITGYRRSFPLYALSFFGYVLTLGGLRLLFHWFPVLMLRCTHTKCPLSEATKILARDTFDEKCKMYHIEDVIEAKIDGKKHSLESDSLKLKQQSTPTIRIYLNNGKEFELPEIRLVKVKRLTYVWITQNGAFLKLSGLNNAKTKVALHAYKGLAEQEAQTMRIAYGKNDISIPVPTIFSLVLLEALNPFYFFQAFSIVVWILGDYYYYCIAIVVMSIFGISTSVVETYKNEKNLHDLINKKEIVTVRRKNGCYETIETTELVPGDVIVVPQHGYSMLCDAVILDGNCVVDESMLTGESLPVSKTSLGKTDDIYNVDDDARHTLFSGTRVIRALPAGHESSDGQVHAVVVNTGFLTTKGGLIRSILYPPPADYVFDNDSYKFIWYLAALGFSGILYTCIVKWGEENLLDTIVDSLDLLTITIPPALPASMAIGKIYAMNRLKKRHISCINSRVINVSGSIDFVCFDKTGTLTQDGSELNGVIPVEGQSIDEAFNVVGDLPFSHLLYGMATCHSLTVIDGKLIGDPLEAKMFEWTSWEIQVDELFSSVSPKNNQLKVAHQLKILHQFQFLSQLQRMSVIVNKITEPKRFIAYCKGSPEMIASLSTPESVPLDYTDKLKMYTRRGFRVLALGWRYLDLIDAKGLASLRREDVERDLTLCGLLVFENKLKGETKSTIKELKGADLTPVMITGDNLQTAVCVARECGIMTNENAEENVLESETDWNKFRSRFQESGGKVGSYCQLAMTGTVWNKVKSECPNWLSDIVTKTPVFARMTSEQKKQVVIELQRLGYTVAMCGDGANDCSALKAANVGISLSQAEASVASPFTYREENISCVPTVIKEGRAALATALGIFKFMVLYSYTEFFSTVFLYYFNCNLSDLEFLLIDCGIIVVCACFFGQTEAFKHELVAQPLPARILTLKTLLSMFMQVILVSVTQIASFEIAHIFSWFESFQFTIRDDVSSYENYAIFTLSQYQYITLAVVFSMGPPFRQPMYTNRPFTLAISLMTLICLYVTLYPANWLIYAIDFRFPPNENFPVIVVGIALVYSVCSIFIEEFIVNYVFAKKIKWR